MKVEKCNTVGGAESASSVQGSVPSPGQRDSFFFAWLYSVRPSYRQGSADALHVSEARSAVERQQLAKDAERYAKGSDRAVAVINAHTNHHVHIRGADGKKRPLRGCWPKKRGGVFDKEKCKSGAPWPVTSQYDDGSGTVLLCPGIAKALGLPGKWIYRYSGNH